jgi:hypothetical protein
MNLSKDELVKLASNRKISKKVLQRKSKNELVEFITGIKVDKCNPKQIKSALDRAYQCAADGRIFIEDEYYDDSPPPPSRPPLATAPIPPVTGNAEAIVATLQENQLKLEAELIRHEAKSETDHAAIAQTVDQVTRRLNELRVGGGGGGAALDEQRVLAIFEQERDNMLIANTENTKLLVVDTVGKLVDDTVTRVASQLNRETTQTIENASRLAAQRAVDEVLLDTTQIASAVQTVMDQRVTKMIQENLGEVKQSILEVRTSLGQLDSLSVNVSSLELATDSLQGEVNLEAEKTNRRLVEVSNTIAEENEKLVTKIDEIDTRTANLKVAYENNVALVQRQIGDAAVAVDAKWVAFQNGTLVEIDKRLVPATTELAKRITDADQRIVALDQRLRADEPNIAASFKEVRFDEEAFRAQATTELLAQMQKFIRENFTEKQLEYKNTLESLDRRIAILSEPSPPLTGDGGPEPIDFDREAFSSAAAENLLARMREFVKITYGNRQLEYEKKYEAAVPELQKENERLALRVGENRVAVNKNLLDITTVVNVTTGQVNAINENITRVSRDIEAINQDVAVARSDAKTAMSLVDTVDKLALEFPALRAEIKEPLALISSANSRYDELEVATKTAVQDIIVLNEAIRQQRDAVDLRLQTNVQAINEVRQLAQQTNINAANEIQKLFLQYQGLKSEVGAQLAIEASPASLSVNDQLEQQRQTIKAIQARLDKNDLDIISLYDEVFVSMRTRIERLQARLFSNEPEPKRRRQGPVLSPIRRRQAPPVAELVPSADSFALVPSSDALVPSPSIVDDIDL